MFERIKSFRKKKTPRYFEFARLPLDLKIHVLQYVDADDVASFAAASSDCKTFVEVNRHRLPTYEFDTLEICYDPCTDGACLRGFSNDRYSQSVVLSARGLEDYLKCVFVTSTVVLVIGRFTLKTINNQTLSVFKPLSFEQLKHLAIPQPMLKRAIDFFFDMDVLIEQLVPRRWTECEKFKMDNCVLLMHEMQYQLKAAADNKNTFRRLASKFSKNSNENMAFSCRRARNRKESNHYCNKCNAVNLTVIRFDLPAADSSSSGCFEWESESSTLLKYNKSPLEA